MNCIGKGVIRLMSWKSSADVCNSRLYADELCEKQFFNRLVNPLTAVKVGLGHIFHRMTPWRYIDSIFLENEYWELMDRCIWVIQPSSYFYHCFQSVHHRLLYKLILFVIFTSDDILISCYKCKGAKRLFFFYTDFKFYTVHKGEDCNNLEQSARVTSFLLWSAGGCGIIIRIFYCFST